MKYGYSELCRVYYDNTKSQKDEININNLINNYKDIENFIINNVDRKCCSFFGYEEEICCTHCAGNCCERKNVAHHGGSRTTICNFLNRIMNSSTRCSRMNNFIIMVLDNWINKSSTMEIE